MENQNYEVVKYRESLSSWFLEYDFEWFVSLTLPFNNLESGERYLKLWRRNLSKKNSITICNLGIFVTSQITGYHIHLLMFGRNKDGKTLLDMDKTDWEQEWSRITEIKKKRNDFYIGCNKTCGNCKIEPVYDLEGLINNYLTSPKNTPLNHFQLVNPYNQKFLEKYRKQN